MNNGVSMSLTGSVSGAEFELISSPTAALEMLLGASILDSEVNGVTLADGSTVLNGVKLILAPELSANALVRYGWEVGSNGLLTGQFDYSYQDSHFFDITYAPISEEDGYGVLNASLTFDFGQDNQYSVSASGKNITDEEFLVYTFDFTAFFGINQAFFGPPPMYGVSFRARF